MGETQCLQLKGQLPNLGEGQVNNNESDYQQQTCRMYICTYVPRYSVVAVTLSFIVSDVKMAACRHACSSLSLSDNYEVNAEQMYVSSINDISRRVQRNI